MSHDRDAPVQIRWEGRFIRAEGYMENDCPGASECSYLCRDIWNLRQGSARVVLAPRARTTYKVDHWDWVIESQVMQQPPEATEPDNSTEVIDWSDVHMPKDVVCIPSRDENGRNVDSWDDNTNRFHVHPYFPLESQA